LRSPDGSSVLCEASVPLTSAEGSPTQPLLLDGTVKELNLPFRAKETNDEVTGEIKLSLVGYSDKVIYGFILYCPPSYFSLCS
jgi:hypothetical protein